MLRQCYIARFSSDCTKDGGGTAVEAATKMDCLFSNWSDNCSHERLWVHIGFDTWELTDGEEVDLKKNTTRVDEIRNCLLTDSRSE